MRAALKIIATGACVVLGTIVQEAVSNVLKPHPILSDIVSTFAGSLCTGLLTVSLLYYIDHDPFMGYLTRDFDNAISEYKFQGKLFDEYAAKLAKVDIATFGREAAMYSSLADSLETAKDGKELNVLLHKSMKTIGVAVPWGEGRQLDEFMRDKNARLCFKA